jgi:flagellar biosynthesis repressor protein FlbT
MNISLRADEKLYINGAVIRVDRKVSIELLNDVTFLLENHVMQANEATTPLKQIYFVIQIMLMDPSATPGAMALSRKLIDAAAATFETPEILTGLKTVDEMIKRSRNFDAMKALRALFPLELTVMFPTAETSAPHAA